MKLSESETEWAKFGKIKVVSFVGKDFICIGSGCHMLFINIQNKKEYLYHANNREVGEGVRTFVGHRTLSVFALAEKCRNPKIFIKTCPSFSTICEFDKDSIEDYLVLAFTEADYLITLNDTPSFKIFVWNWRNGQQITSIDTDIFGRYQLLRCNLSTPVFFAQVQTGKTKLNVWDLTACGKKCILTPHRITPPSDSEPFSDILWTTEGTLFVLDMLGHVYSMGLDYSLTRVIEWKSSGKTITSFAWYKAGLAIAGPNGEIKHYKKSGNWINDWSVYPPLPMKKIFSNYRDSLIGISEDGEILSYDFAEGEFKFIKRYQSKFNDLCMIYPSGEYFVTLQHNREVTCWKVATGDMTDLKMLKTRALAIKENPEYPYVGVAYSNGVLDLLSLYNPHSITTMASFNLSKQPLNSILFTDIGKLIIAADTLSGEFFIIEGIPGTKMQIIATLETHRQICDYMLVASRTCMRLFVIYVTSDVYIAGNKIARYCIARNKKDAEVKEYKLETTTQMYSKIYATTRANRDRVFYAIPMTTKYLHEIATRRGDPMAKVIGAINTEHQMKKIIIHFDKYHITSYAYDGLVIIRTLDFKEKVGVVMPHYRTYGGVFKAYVDPLNKYVVSLGRDNTLVCTSLKNTIIDIDKQNELHELMASTRFELMFGRETIGFTPTGALEGKTWLEVESINNEETERKDCAMERKSILEEFKSIKAEVQQLLTLNLEGPDNEKLDIQEFNLDVELKEQMIKQSQEECQRTKAYLEAQIVAQDKVTNWIKSYCWNKMAVQGQEINAIFAHFLVNNYVLLPSGEGIPANYLNYITELRKLENQMARDDTFEPWEPKAESELQMLLGQPPKLTEDEKGPNLLEFLEDEEQIEEEHVDPDTETAFLGSVTHTFVELLPIHYTQQQVQTFHQTHIQNTCCLAEIYKVKEYFNKLFEDMMQQKAREMSLVTERNARLRHIISELNYFSTDKITIIVEDPPWLSTEFPESVLKVEDKEVGITPYISPSEQARLDAIAAEEERIRLLLLADDFRERALMVMMNGVLEVRWEDELRKDVPKPKCMLDKLPEEFNEEDLRAVRDYEEEVKFLNSERERYKKMLEAEYGRISNYLRDGIRKFNKKLTDCILTKIQVDSAIRQENLKMSRKRFINNNRILINKREVEILNAMENNRKEIESLQKLIVSLQEIVQELRSNLDGLLTKEKLLEKAFKKDFSDLSPVVQEQSVKLYKRRPKVTMRNVTSVTLTLEVAKCLVSQERTLILTQDCLEFLKSLDTLDLYVNIPPAVDEHTYSIVCKHRRFKIESELKMKAVTMEIAEADSTISTFQKSLSQKKELAQKLLYDLDQVRNERLYRFHDIEIQLVLRQGVVELPTTGNISDFDDAVLVSRKDVETINKIIVRGGNKKIKAMKETMNFRRGIMMMEWEHRRLQMQIEDLESFIEEIDSVKVSKEIQMYLKCKARGIPTDKGLSFEQEIEQVKGAYEKMIQERKEKVKELQQKINGLKIENHHLDEQIASINVDVCEFQLERDHELEKREKDIIKISLVLYATTQIFLNSLRKISEKRKMVKLLVGEAALVPILGLQQQQPQDYIDTYTLLSSVSLMYK